LRHLVEDSGARALVTSTVATIDGRAGLPGIRLVVPGRIAPEGADALDDLLGLGQVLKNVPERDYVKRLLR